MDRIRRIRTAAVAALLALLAIFAAVAGIFLLPKSDGSDGNLRQELLALYETYPDGYDRQILGITDCDRAEAERIADTVGGTLEMDARLRYGRIVLPETTDAEEAIGKLDDRQLVCLSPSAVLYPADLSVDDSFAQIEENLSLDLMNLGSTWSVTAGKTAAKRVKIAVIDSGIDWTHPELSGRISEESYSVPLGKSVRDAGGDWTILDATGTPHGTQVSSIIMAAANNAAGFAGIAYDCEFVFIKLTDTNGTFRSDEMMSGIRYAADIGCDVVNLSLGASVTIQGCEEVVNYANSRGCVVVCAAGNDTTEVPHYPSSCAGAISVGALSARVNKSKAEYEAHTAIAYYSNFGEGQVDVVAPGTWLTATDSRFAERNPSKASSDISARQYFNNEWYNTGNGTSLACPAVAAVIGLYRSVHPEATTTDVRVALLASCRDLGDGGADDYYGYGLVDIERFVLGETVTVTYDWGAGTAITPTTVSASKGGRINSLPTLATNGEKLFAGWYADADLTVSAEPLGSTVNEDTTFYAKWTDNAEEAELFDLRLVDPTLRMVALMQTCGDKNGYAVEAKVATAIFRRFSDPRTYAANREEIREIVKTVGNAAMAEAVTDTLCEQTAAYAVYGYRGKAGEVTIPAEVNGIPVVGIGPRAFERKSVTRVNLPDGLEFIGSSAFRNCKKLSWIQIPVTVTEMGSGVFEGTSTDINTNLKKQPDGWIRKYFHYRGAYSSSDKHDAWYGGSGKVKFDSDRTIVDGFEIETTDEGYRLIAYYGEAETLTLGGRDGLKLLSVDAEAFRGNGTLQSLTVSADVGPIGAGAFENCTALETVVIEGDGVVLGDAVFRGCTALQTVTFPGDNVTLGNEAFEACTALESVAFAGETVTWGDAAFKGCTALETVRIPTQMTILPTSSFEGCASLWQAEFPVGSRLTEIASSAFADCVSLSRVSLLNCTELTKLGAAFRGCTALRILSVPRSVTGISFGALRDCNALEWLELPFAGGSPTVAAQGYLGYLFGATDPKDGTVLPESLAVLVVTGRSSGIDGMLTGLCGAEVFLGNPSLSNLPAGNTYRFRGEWSAVPALRDGGIYASLPEVSGAPALLLEKLPAPGGVRLTGVTKTDGGYTFTEEARTYTVKFLDAAGTVLSEKTGLAFGDRIDYPTAPDSYENEIGSYRFLGWSHSTLRVTDDLTVTARYSETKKIYTVTVRDRDSDRSMTHRLEYGATVPPLASYEESGWRYDFRFAEGSATVTGDGELVGYFEKTALTYTVRFKDGDRLIDERTYRWGEIPVLPDAPTREADEKTVYSFAGWSPQVVAVSGNVSYEATWNTEARRYRVVFRNADGTVLSEAECEYGSAVKAPASPADYTKDGVRYRFAGWSPSLVAGAKVTGDLTYTAVWQTETIPPDSGSDTDHNTDTKPAPPDTGDETGKPPAPADGTTEPKPEKGGCASVLRADLLVWMLCIAALGVPAFKRQKMKERRK